MSLDHYRLLGRSGLRVSPLALGTATFGAESGWGTPPEEARKIFDAYIEHGGNFVDTASAYADGNSERLVGEFIGPKRERLVLATKYSLLRSPGDPNAGGNHRKNLMRSAEASLRLLNTDYIDVFYLHNWDFRTPVDEVMRGLDDLVRQGKVLYVAISNSPAWQIARMQTIADLRGWAPLIALQIEYNLIERTVERDLIPMAGELGLGVIPWSPLAGGVLTGRYSRDDLTSPRRPDDGSRKNFNITNGDLDDRAFAINDVLKQVAHEIDHTPAQVALAWTLHNPAVTAPIIGARTTGHLENNLGALDVDLSDDQLARLDQVSALDPGFPYTMLAGPYLQAGLFGGMNIQARV